MKANEQEGRKECNSEAASSRAATRFKSGERNEEAIYNALVLRAFSCQINSILSI